MKCPHCGKEIGGRANSIMDLKDIISAAKQEMERLENCHARISPHGLVWNDKEALGQWKALKIKIKEVNRQIAQMKI